MKALLFAITIMPVPPAAALAAESAVGVRAPNPNCVCVSRPDESIDLVRVRDGKVIWTYASDIWPMDVCIADRESLPACQ